MGVVYDLVTQESFGFEVELIFDLIFAESCASEKGFAKPQLTTTHNHVG